MMLSRIPLLRMLLLAAIALVLPGRARAQAGLSVVAAPAPEYEFGKSMTFEITARSQGASVIGATVFVSAAGDERTFVGEARLTSGTEVTAAYTLDLNKRPLPPFAPVAFWWEVRDSAGGSLTTEPQALTYEDNRFEWRSLAREPVTVHWHQGDTAFGQTALDIAANALERANLDLQAPLPQSVNLYIYADTEAARVALTTTGRVWADGYADPALGVAVVAVADGVEAGVNLEREIPHELTHLLVYQAARDHYANVPTWLNEGLAVMNQGQPDPGLAGALEAARNAKRLLPLSQLCGAFPPDPEQAQLAYAESESVVRFIRERHGSEGLRALLSAYAGGLGCSAGAQKALGMPLEELEGAWLEAALDVSPLTASAIADPLAWLIYAAIVLTPLAVSFLLISRRRAARPSASP